MWFVLCSGIIFGANAKSMLTVDHFARDEHDIVLKTGKSACVRMDAWKVHHSLGTTNDTRTSPTVKHNILLINTNKPSGCCQLCFGLL